VDEIIACNEELELETRMCCLSFVLFIFKSHKVFSDSQSALNNLYLVNIISHISSVFILDIVLLHSNLRNGNFNIIYIGFQAI